MVVSDEKRKMLAELFMSRPRINKHLIKVTGRHATSNRKEALRGGRPGLPDNQLSHPSLSFLILLRMCFRNMLQENKDGRKSRRNMWNVKYAATMKQLVIK